MKPTIFIPEKINVGYQERNDTYTGKLAYIIYFDEKGVLRKEASWNKWRKEDFGNDIYENIPTEGFVLNKKVGDYVSSWNHRQAYVRVYDPRNFEFEITIENLLYILENENSIKGKGLEGEYVYGWDGKNLILIPTSSSDYKGLQNYTNSIKNSIKLKSKDLIVGATYLSKNNEEWVYLGKFDSWKTDYNTRDASGIRTCPVINKGKTHYFYLAEEREKWCYSYIKTMKSLNSLIQVISEEVHPNFTEMFEAMERDTEYSPIDKNADKYIPYTLEEVETILNTERSYGGYKNLKACRSEDKLDITIGHNIYNRNQHPEKYVLSYNLPVEKVRYGSTYMDSEWHYEFADDIETLFNITQPHYKNIYLENGKLYRSEKITND